MSHENFLNKKEIVEKTLKDTLDIESIDHDLKGHKDFRTVTTKYLNSDLSKLNKLNNPMGKIVDDDAKSISNMSKLSQNSKMSQNQMSIRSSKISNYIKLLTDEIQKENKAKDNALNIL